MKLCFFGNNPRGFACLESLLESSHVISRVVLHPKERESRRGGCDIEGLARSRHIPVLRPSSVNAPAFVRKMEELGVDVGVFAGFSEIVGLQMLRTPRLGCINLHGGKLPDYRGSSPLNWAMINGEEEVTLTVVKMDAGIDTGPVLREESIPLDDDMSITTLHRKTLDLFPGLLLKTLEKIEEEDRIKGRPQDPAHGRYWPLRRPSDGLLIWEQMTDREVFNMVRALTDPYPGAFSYYRGKRLLIWKASLTARSIMGIPGRVVQRKRPWARVMCKNRCIQLDRVQYEGDERKDAFDTIAESGTSFRTIRTLLDRDQAA